MLAGISVDYYLRLEQGRDSRPSAEVINALAEALRLNIKAAEYLHQLAAPRMARTQTDGDERVVAGTGELIDQFPMPAIVVNRWLDVLAANPPARALQCGFTAGTNFLRWRLLDPRAREMFVDWDEATDVAVSGLREAAGSASDDPRLRQFVTELSSTSERFRELWARAEVGYRTGVMQLRHPLAGDLFLLRNRFNIPHSGGQHLLTYRAEPGSATAAALEQLRC